MKAVIYAMKDLMSLVDICKSELDSLGIKYGIVRSWTVNTRAKRRLGQCRKVGRELFDINISATLLKDDVDDKLALNTIMHELLHTVKGCFNHTGKWKEYAEYINTKLSGYDIKRVAKPFDVGVALETKESIYKYILRCTKCGQEIKRQKQSKVILNYKRYRCGKCGGRLERIL